MLLAVTIPARTRIDPSAFLARGQAFLGDFAAAAPAPAAGPALAPGRPGPRFINEGQQTAVLALEEACEHVQTPLHRLEHALHPWVAFAIMPLFALANAGVSLSAEVLARAVNPVTLGVFAGLVVGKQVGITGAAWLATRTGIAALPAGVSWRQIYGAAWLGGIGFTMSLFIAALAFEDEPTLAAAKIGILGASLVAGVTGWAILRAASESEAEGETEGESEAEGEAEREAEAEGEGAGAVRVG